MKRIKELLGRITELNDDELEELKSLILAQADESQADPNRVHGTDDFAVLEILASASTQWTREVKRREDNVMRAHEATRVLASFGADPHSHASARIPVDRRPRGLSMGTGRALTASGAEMHDSAGLTREFLDVLRREQGATGTDGEKVRVATLRTDRGPSRTLRASDSAEAITASPCVRRCRTRADAPRAAVRAAGHHRCRRVWRTS